MIPEPKACTGMECSPDTRQNRKGAFDGLNNKKNILLKR